MVCNCCQRQQLLNFGKTCTVTGHHFFTLVTSVSKEVGHELCQVTRFVVLREGDDLFRPGNNGESVLSILTGRLSHVQSPLSSPVPKMTSVEVEPGTWICEAALWTNWIHVGPAMAAVPCQLVRISAEGATSAMKKERRILDMALTYAIEYHHCLCNDKPPLGWPTDLVVPDTEFGDIASSMDADIRNSIVMARLKADHVMNRRSLVSLSQEVINGSAGLTLDCVGEPRRMVTNFALKVTRDDGNIFAQIGYMEDHDIMPMVPMCRFPGIRKRL